MEKLINPTWRALREDQSFSVLQSDDRRDTTLERSQRTLEKVISREIMYFKIMKFVYDNSICTKTF